VSGWFQVFFATLRCHRLTNQVGAERLPLGICKTRRTSRAVLGFGVGSLVAGGWDCRLEASSAEVGPSRER
jgi:hypothetical protein